ncbi:hypothetical protein ACFLZZ_01250 [Nanoarchaeota archaeon]
MKSEKYYIVNRTQSSPSNAPLNGKKGLEELIRMMQMTFTRDHSLFIDQSMHFVKDSVNSYFDKYISEAEAKDGRNKVPVYEVKLKQVGYIDEDGEFYEVKGKMNGKEK